MIKRLIQKTILKDLAKNKVLVLLGARQVGKTTLLENLISDKKKSLWINCDNFDERLLLEHKTTTELRHLLSPYEIVCIDEAQRVTDIGLTIKMVADIKDLNTHVIITGSSALELSEGINEPATGRTIEYKLFPFSLAELAANTSLREETRMLEQRMIYGLYPNIVTDQADARRNLINLANNYLYKDLLAFKGIQKPVVLQKLVRALALQLGNEVSYNELAGLLGIDKETVESYIDLLEKSFVVFRLESYSRNLRNEIRKGKKVYFFDNGVRNAVISNFAPLELRNDTGALWENLMISERVKRNAYSESYARMYFWRTHDQKEIDLIEEMDGKLSAFEIKYNPKAKAALPKNFLNSYPDTAFKIVNSENFSEFIF